MKDVKVSIRATDVKSLKYENNFSGKAGERLDLEIKSGLAVKLNPAAPTVAVVFTKFEAMDKKGVIKFELETATPVAVSTFIDNLDEYIKLNYMSSILLAVNEKIRTTATLVGLNLNTPSVDFRAMNQNDEDDDIKF